MKILAIDIGAGTEDILLYDDQKLSVENCIKMVLPSPSIFFAEQVKIATRKGKDLFVKGDTVGGGAFSHAIKKHVESGFRVYMTENAAYTVRNNLDQVRDLGIKIVQDSGPEIFEGVTLVIEEVNIDRLRGFLKFFGEPFSDIDFVAVAVQDHGIFPAGMSNRRFRVNKVRKLLEKNPRPEAFAFSMNRTIRDFKSRSRTRVANMVKKIIGKEIQEQDFSYWQ